MYHLGIDIGSTTAKIALMDSYNQLVFHRYRRHNARPMEALGILLAELSQAQGDIALSVILTGTAGMGIAERAGLPFIQEVIASSVYVSTLHPEVKTLVDIGGEDGKIILFEDGKAPTIRMNGNCAGGTGAFIDQMASLLNIEVQAMSDLGASSTRTYPMASRCGVFAKTDVQTLIARHIPKEDVISSVYRAVAFQTISSLAHGADIRAQIIFSGGPLSFQAGLRGAFLEVLGLQESDVARVSNGELIPAMGAALSRSGLPSSLGELSEILKANAGLSISLTPVLAPLFTDREEFFAWGERKSKARVPRVSIEEALEGKTTRELELFLGIDCGSRTLKLVLTDLKGRLVHGFYAPNDGDPLACVQRGLAEIRTLFAEAGITPLVVSSASTGYGEELLKGALGLDHGYVETMAHFRAAQSWEPDVSFILDIGGQDIKAIFIEDRVIQNIELNEACSSGTGSFIETFAQNLGYSVEDFSLDACLALAPRDLGSRCTVFMNSKVKQALREGAEPGEISAGLAYSVIKNCFQKVLKISDPAILGQHIVVQGGTFKNPAVLRALELYIGKEVLRPDIAELMGAYGAALLARDEWETRAVSPALVKSGFIGFGRLDEITRYERDELVCKACENLCSVGRIRFGKDRLYYTGNKCERVFGNRQESRNAQPRGDHADPAPAPGINLVAYKRDLLFKRALVPEHGARGLRIGIPRVLNMYEDFPFWCTLLTAAGCTVVLSEQGTPAQAESGYSYVMSENICYPAKIVGGHILNLIDKGVDRILYPMVRHDREDYKDSLNSFNCPVVTGYPQVIASSLDPEKKFGVPFDHPPFSFRTLETARDGARAILSVYGIDRHQADRAFKLAMDEWETFHYRLRSAGKKALDEARAQGKKPFLLLGRPYHADGVVNHRVPEILEGYGVLVLTEDTIPLRNQEQDRELGPLHVLTQWAFPNRFYEAAIWASEQEDVEVVQLNSFGCGPDALTVDEVRAILQAAGKYPTLLRIDEVSSPGSIRLRLRSMLESMKKRPAGFMGRRVKRESTRVFQSGDKERTILAPMFSPFYTDIMVEAFRAQGYRMEILPMPDHESRDAGLASTSHDICYPATLVIGDIMKVLKSGRYQSDEVAVAITQTGGQCRASSYASILKQAMVQAGFKDIPMVTLTAGKAGKGLNEQPGFQVSMLKMGLSGFYGILFADALAKLFYATRPRESKQGSAWALVEHYLHQGVSLLKLGTVHRIFGLLEEAVSSFAGLLAHARPLPRIGLVGEIYVKFNPFANGYICDTLMDMGLEPDVPPLVNFFIQKLVVTEFNHSNHVEKSSLGMRAVMGVGNAVVQAYFERCNRILKAFPLALTPFHSMEQLAHDAQKVLSLINQYGESWLIAGDIGGFAASGTDNVVCLQPFGCIANHIIAKGVEKKLKEVYPRLNILFLDMDAGASEVNISNRLEFLARQAKNQAGTPMGIPESPLAN